MRDRERSNQISIMFARDLQSTTNYFLLSLALADLLVCTIVMPFGAATFIMGRLISSSELIRSDPNKRLTNLEPLTIYIINITRQCA